MDENNANASGNNAKLFTQEDVNEIVQARLERERAKYGSDDMDSLKEQLKALESEKEGYIAQIDSMKKQNAIVDCLNDCDCINAKELSKIFIGDIVTNDDGTFSVSNSEMDMKAYIQSWIDQNTWAKKVRSIEGFTPASHASRGNNVAIEERIRQEFLKK